MLPPIFKLAYVTYQSSKQIIMTVLVVQPQNNALVSPVPAAPPASPDAKLWSMGFFDDPADVLRPVLCITLGVEQLKLLAMTHET